MENEKGNKQENTGNKQQNSGNNPEKNNQDTLNSGGEVNTSEKDPNFEADSTRKLSVRDIIFLKICRKAEEQGNDRIDSGDLFKDYVTSNFEMEEDQFKGMLRELETYGYIKINDETGETRENLAAEKPSIQIMEEGKKYKLVLDENLAGKNGQ